MSTIAFKVDAALLRELGERLVGKPHVALAELIKNSYDADASMVELKFLADTIEVSDNGHGMDEAAFRDFWMRIGSQHKQKQRESPGGRTLTGQKGVGRLAVQFLGRGLKLLTKCGTDKLALSTSVDWDEAVKKDDLTSVELEYERVPLAKKFPGESESGTRLTISSLSQPWTAKELKAVALEIWALQPPFETGKESVDFKISVVDTAKKVQETFDLYAQAFKTLWHAKIIGGVVPPKKPRDRTVCSMAILFDDGTTIKYQHEVSACPIKSLHFDISIYSLTGRQPMGVSVGELRKYLQNHGGVGIYDTGFRLPFYGVDTDWLRVQLDHSRRLTHSELLPTQMQEARGLNYLPTNARILGSAHVRTGEERRWVDENKPTDVRPLEISITRDRLTENEAYEVLRQCVRAGLDFYAVTEAARELKAAESKKPINEAASAVQKIADIVEEHSNSLPPKAIASIKSVIKEATSAVKIEKEIHGKQANLLGALATAGIAAAAFDHEYTRQFRRFDEILESLHGLTGKKGDVRAELKKVEAQLLHWATEIRATRQLFSPVSDKESREQRTRYRARPLLEQVKLQLGPLVRSVEFDFVGIPEDIRLPSGTFVEWSALFQNVLANAINATLDASERRIEASFRNEGAAKAVFIQDTGAGVDLASSEELFEPFVQKLKISNSRKGLRIGGTGLGLAIVRMIAVNLGCNVSFAKPKTGFATAFRLAWSEKE